MAWISLVIVALLFFAPGVGLGSKVVVSDIPVSLPLPFVSSFAFRIPFTGPLRLFLECTGTWLVLWLIPFLLDRRQGEIELKERKSYKFLLQRIGLWDDLVNAFRPYITNQLATTLAKILLGFMLIRAVLIYILQAILDSIVPHLADWLASQFGSQFAPLISAAITQGLQFLLRLGPDNGAVVIILCLLVLIANRTFHWEQEFWQGFHLRVKLVERKTSQRDITIPATQ
jgi:hypothetical protein